MRRLRYDRVKRSVGLQAKGAVMKKSTQKAMRFVGLDVHAETIAVAVAEPDGEVRSIGTIPNRQESVSRLVKKLSGSGSWEACYEAGPTGYALYWQLTKLGIVCTVVAPTLVPMKAGDRVKTDRRDAERLARSFRAGDLTAVWVPDTAHEALRDLVRAREAAKRDELRARHRLGKFLLRQGRRPPEKMHSWTKTHLQWIKTKVTFEEPAQQWVLNDYLNEVDHCGQRIQRLEDLIDEAVKTAPETMREVIAALQALRGIAAMSAVTIVAELGEISRFATARQLMGYSGAVPSEHSSGEKTRRGHITKTGNSHLRRIIVEAAWSQRLRPILSRKVKLRQEGLDPEIIEIASKAMHRLHKRYMQLLGKGKTVQQVVTAVAREMLGFIWAIGVSVEQRGSA
jgi:transposase